MILRLGASDDVDASTSTLCEGAAASASPTCEDVAGFRRAALLLIGVGVVVRIAHFLLRLPIWNDEAMLAANFLNRGFAELFRPLDNCQVAPLLFLWIESAIVQVAGFTEYSLRLAPLLAGIGSLVAFDQLARRTLDHRSRLLALCLLATAHYPIRYSAEVKPYSLDFLVSIATLGLALAWLRRPDQRRWLWLLAAWSPPAVMASVPAPFTLGGILIGLAAPVWRTGDRRNWAAFSVFAASLLVSFALYLHFFLEPHSRAQEVGMSSHWAEAFMPIVPGWEMLRFLIESATGVVFCYPVGGENFGSTLTSMLFGVGVWTMFRQGRTAVLGVLLGPFAVGLAAAAMHKYPFGGHARVMQYLGPGVCLLAGLGASELIGRITSATARRRLTGVVVGLVVALGVGAMFKLMIRPYYELACRHRRDFAEWFWPEQSRIGPLVCINDVLRSQRPESGVNPASCEFLCNRAIYELKSTSPASGYVLQWTTPDPPADCAALKAWLEEASAGRKLISHERYPVGQREVFEVFRFADQKNR